MRLAGAIARVMKQSAELSEVVVLLLVSSVCKGLERHTI
jgi:hypothetical protein